MTTTWSVQKKNESTGMWHTWFWDEESSAQEKLCRGVIKLASELYPNSRFRLIKRTANMEVFDER